jgi:hypothetical protein
MLSDQNWLSGTTKSDTVVSAKLIPLGGLNAFVNPASGDSLRKRSN